jgi:hypothetical protein
MSGKRLAAIVALNRRGSSRLLVLALGYRFQEIEHGGLGKSIRRKLQTMAKALRQKNRGKLGGADVGWLSVSSLECGFLVDRTS